MPLMNYTTKVPPEQTAGEIVGILARSGASEVSTRYNAGRPVGIAFSVETAHGPRRFVMPARASAVQRTLAKQYQQGKVSRALASEAQAERVGWRILKDWVQAQMAIIEVGMASLDEVMLPYLETRDGRTVYEVLQAHAMELPALPDPPRATVLSLPEARA